MNTVTYRRALPLLLALLVTTSIRAGGEVNEALARLKRGVVRVEVDGAKSVGTGIVTGFDQRGLFILTAYHTVRQAQRIQVLFEDSTQALTAKLVANRVDRDNDFAVIQIAGPVSQARQESIPTLEYADASSFEAGTDGAFAKPIGALTAIGQNGRWQVMPLRLEALNLDGLPSRMSVAFEKPISSAKGASGGPLFGQTPSWRLLGMVIEETPKGLVVVKIPVILAALKGWGLPVNRLDPLAEQPAKPYLWVLTTKGLFTLDPQENLRVLRYKPLVNRDDAFTAPRRMATSLDGRFAIVINTQSNAQFGLVRVDVNGEVSWMLPGSFQAVSVSDSGRVFVLRGPPGGVSWIEELEAETGHRIIKGGPLGQAAVDMVVDEKRGWIWAAGAAITRLDLDLNPLWTDHPGRYTSIDFLASGNLVAIDRSSITSGRLLLLRASSNPRRIDVLATLNDRPRQVRSLRFGEGVGDVYVIGESNTVSRYNTQFTQALAAWPSSSAPDPHVALSIAGDGLVWLASANALVRCTRDGACDGPIRNIGSGEVVALSVSLPSP
jgi:Trypsin-like peptidase domain